MKFSYCFSVRKNPVGLPVVMISPSFTKNVPGAQLTFTQPVRSLPLNIGWKPTSFVSPAHNGATAASAIRTAAGWRNRFMVSPPSTDSFCTALSCLGPMVGFDRVDGRQMMQAQVLSLLIGFLFGVETLTGPSAELPQRYFRLMEAELLQIEKQLATEGAADPKALKTSRLPGALLAA